MTNLDSSSSTFPSNNNHAKLYYTHFEKDTTKDNRREHHEDEREREREINYGYK
jgi:hypothetical protein